MKAGMTNGPGPGDMMGQEPVIIQINENTWRIENTMVRFFLLTGTKKALLIDTGMTVPNAREIAESLTDLPVTLLNTHADPDHISGNSAFKKVLMHPAEEANYRAHGGTCEIEAVKEGDSIDLGERVLKVIALPGHTPGSIALVDINNRVLYSGDTVQDGQIFMFQERRDMKKYLESLEHLSIFREEFDQIFPSHGTLPLLPSHIGKLMEGAKAILERTADYKIADMFGTPVAYYKFEYAGFLCDIPKE